MSVTIPVLTEAQRQGDFATGTAQLPNPLPAGINNVVTFAAVMPLSDLQDPTKSFTSGLYVSPDNSPGSYVSTGRVLNFTGSSILTRMPSVGWDLSSYAGQWVQVQGNVPVSMNLGFNVTVQ